MDKKIFCIGGATIDYKLKSIHSLELSTSNPVSSIMTFGGVAHNVALNLAHLTDKIFFQSVIGNDSDGLQLLKNLQDKNINTEKSIILENNLTARYYAVLDHSGEMHIALIDMMIYETIPFDTFTSSWNTWQQDNIVFIDTNLPTQFLEYAIHLSHLKKLKLCIDPVSISKAKKIPFSLEGVFLIKPDRYELCSLTNMPVTSIEDCMKAATCLLKRGVNNIIVSLGSLGYILVNENMQKHFDAVTVNSIVDVSGAGDAFIAGVLYELKQDATLVEACETGAKTAALTVQSQHTVSPDMCLSNLNKKENKYAEFY